MTAPAQAQVFSAADCRAVRGPQDLSGFQALPQGELFCGLLGDPKAPRSSAIALHGSADAFPSQIGAVGIGDWVGVFRWGRVQLDLFGAVFSQFDLGAPSFDLINADYLVGLPITFRYRGFSGRLRAYHQSSHLGDEFLLRSQVDRENLSFESVELLLSQTLGPVRLYGGGEGRGHLPQTSPPRHGRGRQRGARATGGGRTGGPARPGPAAA